MPKSYYVKERMSVIQEEYVENFGEELTDPTRLAQIARTQAARYESAHSSGPQSFTFPRGGSQRHRVN